MMRPLLTRRIDRSIAAFHDGKICTKESPIMKMLERGMDEQIAPPRSERDSPTKRMAGPTVENLALLSGDLVDLSHALNDGKRTEYRGD